MSEQQVKAKGRINAVLIVTHTHVSMLKNGQCFVSDEWATK